MAETKKTTSTTKKTTTKKPTTRKNTSSKKPASSTTKKSSTSKKPTTQTTKKTSTSTTKKTTQKKTSTSKGVEALRSEVPKKKTVSTRKGLDQVKPKTTSKGFKNTKKSSNLSSQEGKTVKKTTRTRKPKTIVETKKQDDMTTLEVLGKAMDQEVIKEKQKYGKTFYLIFGLAAYAAAFFYVNEVLYDSGDLVQSAIFAFAAVFIMFVLMLFNVHMLVINFFYLPFKRLFKQSRKEIYKEIIFSVGKSKVQTAINKYRSLFTLILYFIIAIMLGYASVMGSLAQGDEILPLIASALITELIFLVVVCSWQYLFNILPSILEKSIDAKNGFVLTLSAAVIVIYIVFLILDIYVLAEIMIFLLIIGFVSLLGVNLNMIVGEINIFQNLRGRKSKAITRVVFTIFFAFHVYVVIYASVVAYSIYNWEPNSFVFNSADMVQEITTDLSTSYGTNLSTVYWDDDLDSVTDVVPLTSVYNINGGIITDFIDTELQPLHTIVFDSSGRPITLYDQNGIEVETAMPSIPEIETCEVFYNNGSFACSVAVPQPHTYGDFLYWTVVTVSTIGYGDIHPSTEYNVAMVWGGFLGMYGLTFFALSISFVSNIAMEGYNSRREERKKND